MGHANIETTMDIYAEAKVGAKQKAIENLSNNLKLFQKENLIVRDVKSDKRREKDVIIIFLYTL